jgi:acyl-CoA synthetase
MCCDSVDKAAAFPIADARLGERVCLAVVANPRNALDTSTLLRDLDRAGLGKYDMPEFILLLAEMPLTASGKIIKRELVRWVVEGRVRPRALRD